MTHVPKITVLAETADTVTIKRIDLDAIASMIEDAIDLAAVRALDAEIASRGLETVLANGLALEDAERLWAGEHPLKVWREKRGLSQRALGEAAGVAQGYLAEIEKGIKPGSVTALRKLAGALRVQVDDLIPEQTRGEP